MIGKNIIGDGNFLTTNFFHFFNTVLIEKFNIKLIRSVNKDIEAMTPEN